MILPMLAGILFFVRSNTATDSRLRNGATRFSARDRVRRRHLDQADPALALAGLRLRAPPSRRHAAGQPGDPGLLSLLFGFPQIPIWDSLGRFIYVTRLNDLFWWIIEETFWPNPRQKNYHYNVVIIIAVLAISILFLRNWKRGLLWGMGTALFLSPVLHPWYCTWILPLAAWRRVDGWQVLSVTIFAYYLFWNERLFLLPWHSEPWLRAFIFIPPVVTMLFAWRRQLRPNDVATSG